MSPAFTEETQPEAIRRAQDGDAAAFEYLYKANSKRVYSLCLRMLKNTSDVEDLTQQIFLRLFRKIGTFRGHACFSTWLHRVAVNAVLMHLRRKRPDEIHANRSNPDGANVDASQECGVSDISMLGAIERSNLARAIGRLPAGYKRLFLLHDVMGYQHNEIAKLVGCSIGCSKSQVHRARKRLQHLLHGEQLQARQELAPTDGTDAAVTEIGPKRHADVTYRLTCSV